MLKYMTRILSCTAFIFRCVPKHKSHRHIWSDDWVCVANRLYLKNHANVSSCSQNVGPNYELISCKKLVLGNSKLGQEVNTDFSKLRMACFSGFCGEHQAICLITLCFVLQNWFPRTIFSESGRIATRVSECHVGYLSSEFECCWEHNWARYIMYSYFGVAISIPLS